MYLSQVVVQSRAHFPSPFFFSFSIVISFFGSAAYARTILEGNKDPNLKVLMADIGAQDGPVPGVHQKNTVKYVYPFCSSRFILFPLTSDRFY
jgi:hypothetical protein